MKARVLITGGAGYLGSILCEHLLGAGYQVTVVDSLLYGQRSLFQFCANPHFEFVFGDVRNEELMQSLVKRADVLIPLAAIVGAPACDRDPWTTRSVNFEALRLINRLRSPQQVVIFPTTNSGYGTRTGDVFCTEETPLEPISLYGRTKVQAEMELLGHPIHQSSSCHGLRHVAADALDLLVNHFVYAAVTDGYVVIFEKDFKRNYVHIRDVADCFLHCIEPSTQMVGRALQYRACDAANLSKAELALKIKEYVPKLLYPLLGDRQRPGQAELHRVQRRLRQAGFGAHRSLDEGIRSC